MKKLLKISSKIILFFVFALFSSCEKDLYEEAIIESKSKVNYVTIEEVPFLIPNIQEFNHDYDYLTSSNKKNLNKETLNLNLELDRILEYISTTGEKTYSINIIKEFLPYQDKYVENLSVFKIDDSYKSLLIKYNENDDLKNFDFSTFTGEVSFSTIDNVLISFMTMVDGNKFHYKEIDGVLTYYGDGFDVVISADGTVTINYHPPISSNGNTGSNGNTESNGNTGGAGPIGNNSGTGGAGSNNSEFVYSLPHINITPNPPLPITQFLTQLNDSTINYSQNFYNLDLSAQSVIVTYLESINYHATTQIKASLIAIFSNTANNNWLANADEATQVSVFNNLVQNNFNSESTGFVNQMISACLVNGGTFTFDNNLTTNNSQVFNSVTEAEQFILNNDVDGSDFETIESGTEKTAKIKVALLGPAAGIKIDIKQEINPYNIVETTSNAYGVTLIFGWNQTGTDDNVIGNVATVNVYGLLNYNFIINGYGTVYSQIKHYQIKLNTVNGNIISAIKID